MPIEIRELVIKATIADESKTGKGTTAGSNNSVSMQEEIVNACVEKVMEILKEKMER